MAKKKKSTPREIPAFLKELLLARSPSGSEQEAQAVVDRHLEAVADSYERDRLGNRRASLHPAGSPTVMLSGHMDELGFIITHINEQGFLYFDTIGGHDRVMIPGRRVEILTVSGTVAGVTGKRAVHLMTPEDRKKVPEIHEMWIDIGAKDKKEAQSRVSIGDVAVYDHTCSMLHGSLAVSRAFDNKAGAYIVAETLLRCASSRKKLSAHLIAVATSQEEIGVRGATTAAYGVNPDIAVAVDVGHSTDHPDCDPRKHGQTKLGGGPILCRGPNINPFVYERLVQCAKAEKIPFQLEADPGPTGTDARAIQLAREGVATGLISLPLRYMHTPSEIVDLEDVENCVRLLTAFVLSLQPGDTGIF